MEEIFHSFWRMLCPCLFFVENYPRTSLLDLQKINPINLYFILQNGQCRYWLMDPDFLKALQNFFGKSLSIFWGFFSHSCELWKTHGAPEVSVNSQGTPNNCILCDVSRTGKACVLSKHNVFQRTKFKSLPSISQRQRNCNAGEVHAPLYKKNCI